ncbi:MAG: hypothetical protein HOE90_04475 [Bacteriovoracaceae bacterium]|jgi:hypothetical protein|nr:hypothetical protein [Bacteriovoracaceae bacterium]
MRFDKKIIFFTAFPAIFILLQLSLQSEGVHFDSNWYKVPHLAILAVYFIFILPVIFSVKKLSNYLSLVSSKLGNGMKGLMHIAKDLSDLNFGILQSSEQQQEASLSCVNAMEQITQTVSKNAEFTQSSESLTKQVNEKTIEGQKMMEELMDSMKVIQNSNEALEQILEVIANISNNSEIISKIAFESKILACNANIEAERAGEFGKSFSVVSKEMNALADNTSKAAKDIDAHIKNGQNKIQEIISETKVKIDDGHEKALHAQGVFGFIVENIQKVYGNINSIAASSKEQQIGISEVMKAIGQLDKSIHENCSISLSGAENSKQLAQSCKAIDEDIRQFSVTSRGRSFRHEVKSIIDLAGRQRMLIQKISKDVLFISCNVNKEDALSDLKISKQEFGQVLDGLLYGSKELRLTKIKEPAITEQLRYVKRLWREFLPLINGAEKGQINSTLLRELARQNPLILDNMNKAVNLIQDYSNKCVGNGEKSDGANILNISGRQRMLSQKITKELLLITGGIEPENNRRMLANSMTLFERSLNGLLKGDSDQGLPGTHDPELIKQLSTVYDIWGNCKKTINVAINSGQASLGHHDLIALYELNLRLLKESNKAVQLFMFWSI